MGTHILDLLNLSEECIDDLAINELKASLSALIRFTREKSVLLENDQPLKQHENVNILNRFVEKETELHDRIIALLDRNTEYLKGELREKNELIKLLLMNLNSLIIKETVTRENVIANPENDLSFQIQETYHDYISFLI